MEFRDTKFSIKFRRNFALWTTSLLLALILNILLFGLMPSLISPVKEKYGSTQNFRIENVIRLKRQETPVRKKEIKKPEKIEEIRNKPKQIGMRPTPVKQVTLTFEFDPKLPVTPGALTIPAVKMVAMGHPGLRDAYGVGELDEPLTAIAQAPPVYPLRAKRLGIEGWVKVQFLVTDHGFVDKIEILDAEPSAVFNESVIRCLSSWRFKPGTANGKAVNTWASTTIRFELN